MMNTKQLFSYNMSRFFKQRGAKAELARYCGVEQSTVKGWADGTYFPTPENIDKICLFLSIDCSQLFSATPMSTREIQLLSKFNRLNDKGKESALGMLDVLLGNADFAKESA